MNDNPNRRVLIRRSGVYDIINETDWPADFLRWVTMLMYPDGEYIFDETDQCVWYVGYQIDYHI